MTPSHILRLNYMKAATKSWMRWDLTKRSTGSKTLRRYSKKLIETTTGSVNWNSFSRWFTREFLEDWTGWPGIIPGKELKMRTNIRSTTGTSTTTLPRWFSRPVFTCGWSLTRCDHSWDSEAPASSSSFCGSSLAASGLVRLRTSYMMCLTGLDGLFTKLGLSTGRTSGNPTRILSLPMRATSMPDCAGGFQSSLWWCHPSMLYMVVFSFFSSLLLCPSCVSKKETNCQAAEISSFPWPKSAST